jgi:uncharacterized damage-inducible protein DinB
MNADQLFGHWDAVRQGLLQALDQLTNEQLQFTPRPELRTIGAVACHIASAENGWFGHCVWRETAEWPADFSEAEYASVAAINDLLGRVHDRTKAYLAAIPADAPSPAGVDQAIVLPWGPQVPLRWVVWHVLEHEIHHRGEIYLMLGLLGMEAPDV